jgi:hypothetical protein
VELYIKMELPHRYSRVALPRCGSYSLEQFAMWKSCSSVYDV